MELFERIVTARGIDLKDVDKFLNPDYSSLHDPFLMPDMKIAVKRLLSALLKQENITVYGDYDIDGLSATALLLDAFNQFGFKNVDYYIPDRFSEGFGLSISSIKKISKTKTTLIVTVDCGSQSHKEIELANQLGIDVIVSDHHEPSDKQPNAVAVINPKRKDSKYLFKDLAGVGVAFKLVQALQKEINKNESLEHSGFRFGQEKWLLDLVALGTVCDIVNLVDENRTNVYWGLKVLAKTRRPGLKSLMDIAKVEPNTLNSRSVGFALGPRLNAAGRLETAQHALDLLLADNPKIASEKALILDNFNNDRRQEQNRIFVEALKQAETYEHQPVLVLNNPGWSHGIVGIVASKMLERHKKPVLIFQEMGETAKGSARSYGDFDLSESIVYLGELLQKGGGHKCAAGMTVNLADIDKVREKLNEFYNAKNLNLDEQQRSLLPIADTEAKLSEVSIEAVEMIHKLEPFGQGNPSPIIETKNLKVLENRKMGSENQHLKILLEDENHNMMSFLSFNFPDEHLLEVGDSVDALYSPIINDWCGRKTVEGRLITINKSKP